jgi:hypothetical protein
MIEVLYVANGERKLTKFAYNATIKDLHDALFKECAYYVLIKIHFN